MNQWTTETKQIISKHNKDFNAKNYSAKIKAYGGFDHYQDEILGGVFKRYHPVQRSGKPVTKLSDYYDALEYVMGMMAIWGFDYNNGKTYWKWGNGSSDRFYTSGKGKCNGGQIYQLCHGVGKRARTTNCNYGINTLLRAMNRYKTASENFVSWGSRYGKPVALKKNLKPGDMVHFFRKSVNRSKVSTWKNKGWHHIAIVHSIEGNKVWLADFGSRFIRSKKPLHYMTLDGSARAGGEYGTDYWGAVHCFNFTGAARESEDKEDD